MALCRFCNLDDDDIEVDDCPENKVVDYPDGSALPSIPYSNIILDSTHEIKMPDRCPECGVAVGNHHHPGCDWEWCPKCNGQIITCSCFETEHLVQEADE